MTYKLEEHIEKYNRLLESPLRIKQLNLDIFQDNSKNFLFTKSVVDKVKTPKDTFKDYKVYSFNNKNLISDIFIYKNNEIASAYFLYSIERNIMCENKVWQDITHSGLCRSIIFEYYLTKFNGIISDGIHSELGEKYWKKLVNDALNNNYKVYILDSKLNKVIKQITDISEMNLYYGNSSTNLNTKVFIKK